MKIFCWPLSIVGLLILSHCGQPTPQTMQTYSIEGIVTDRSGLPMPGVMVAIVDGTSSYPDIAAMTNNKGEFSFGPLNNGEYTVQAFREGLSKQAKASIKNENVKMTIRLE